VAPWPRPLHSAAASRGRCGDLRTSFDARIATTRALLVPRDQQTNQL